MARILYGVQGSGHGHAIRALTIARHFPEHEFRFVSFGAGAAILRQEYPVMECPAPDTVYRLHRIAIGATLSSNLRFMGQRQPLRRQVLEYMDRFQPEVTMTDYDFFIPWASRQVGLPCLSLDHQHIITCCRHAVPWGQRPDYHLTRLVIQTLYCPASDSLVTSFFHPPLRPDSRVRLVPPILRETVLRRRPRDSEHVLAYQGHPTFKRFLPFLRAIPRPVAVYGFDIDHTEGNLGFKKNSEEGFLDDLASCQYVVCGGGHTMISEALFYGKPVLSFPIKNAFEQFLNAFYVDRLGYGRYLTDFRPRPEFIPAFEAKLDYFRNNIRQQQFCGNQEIFALVEQFIRQKGLKPLD